MLYSCLKEWNTLSKLGIEGNFLNLKKNICKKPAGNTILDGEKLKLSFEDQKQGNDVPAHYCFSTS